jgi:hypothetical protein
MKILLKSRGGEELSATDVIEFVALTLDLPSRAITTLSPSSWVLDLSGHQRAYSTCIAFGEFEMAGGVVLLATAYQLPAPPAAFLVYVDLSDDERRPSAETIASGILTMRGAGLALCASVTNGFIFAAISADEADSLASMRNSTAG